MKTAGQRRIWDIDIDAEPRQSRAAIGIVPQEIALDFFFTPRELLDMQAGFYGVPKAERRTDGILEAVARPTRPTSRRARSRAACGGG